MPNIRVGIVGATGYSGEELIRLLLNHKSVDITYLAASAKWEKPSPVSLVFPRFARQLDLPIEALNLERLISACDCAFLALPHGSAMSIVPQLFNAGKRVVDLSGDFRLKDASLYPRWYKLPHPYPEFLNDPRFVYGLSEFHREAISKAQVVANPGCYATSILLGCLPLFEAGLVEDARIIVDAKSGLSGAGRKADDALLFAEVNENLRPYKVNDHQHMPEILQEISVVSGQKAQMLFVPQVIPVNRGIISMIYVRIKGGLEQASKAFQERYGSGRANFVRVRVGLLPQLKDVVGTNYCDIGLVFDPASGFLIVASAIDNLTKGAAGQAIQNFNLMHGIPESAGLTQ